MNLLLARVHIILLWNVERSMVIQLSLWVAHVNLNLTLTSTVSEKIQDDKGKVPQIVAEISKIIH